jgi:hypothetical protein
MTELTLSIRTVLRCIRISSRGIGGTGMKRDVAAHVALCDTCHRVKAEHQRPAGLLQLLKVLEWK